MNIDEELDKAREEAYPAVRLVSWAAGSAYYAAERLARSSYWSASSATHSEEDREKQVDMIKEML